MTLAEEFVRAARQVDAEAYRALCTADSRHWINVGPSEHSLDERVALLAREREVLADFDLHDVRVSEFRNGFVVRATARGSLPTADAVTMAICSVVEHDGERITRVEEYVDRTAILPVLRVL